jgi:anti-sigma B factor antagonist
MPGIEYPVAVVRGLPVVSAPEEIDAANSGGLGGVLLRTAALGHATLVVDMTSTQFCDSAGLHVLVRAHKRAAAEGGELRLVIATPAVFRVFSVTGVDRVIPNFATLAEALAPMPAVTILPPRPVPSRVTHILAGFLRGDARHRPLPPRPRPSA